MGKKRMEIKTTCKRQFKFVRVWGQGVIEEYDPVTLSLYVINGNRWVRVVYGDKQIFVRQDIANRHFYKAHHLQ